MKTLIAGCLTLPIPARAATATTPGAKSDCDTIALPLPDASRSLIQGFGQHENPGSLLPAAEKARIQADPDRAAQVSGTVTDFRNAVVRLCVTGQPSAGILQDHLRGFLSDHQRRRIGIA